MKKHCDRLQITHQHVHLFTTTQGLFMTIFKSNALNPQSIQLDWRFRPAAASGAQVAGHRLDTLFEAPISPLPSLSQAPELQQEP
jgi:hypothetical protein